MQRQESDSPWQIALIFVMVTGFTAIALYAWRQPSGFRLMVFACTTLLALASSVLGGFAGFIFGIPKTVTTTPNDTSAPAAKPSSAYKGNTNLEEISDWLTKILVGASLVELGKIGGMFTTLTDNLNKTGGLGKYGTVVSGTVITLYAVAGFMLAYLYARLYLGRELRDADGDESPDTVLGRMNAALYEPDGYTKVIEMGNELLKIGQPSSAQFWCYMAAAYGQKFKVTKADEDKANALDAVKKAIAMDPSTKLKLRTWWKPVPGSKDDDLSAFSEDVEFAAVLN
jgi:hypothetical protein